jgi:pimeloyl-ACP methyl ester carboxylesterase
MTSVAPDEFANDARGDLVNPPISRRGVVRAAGAGALALGLGGATLTGTAAPAAASDSPFADVRASSTFGSVGHAPHLPPGFRKTFTSRFIQAGGIRQHAVIGGDGPPLLLVHGWPQNWYAWRLLMPALAEHFTIIAVDQRGIGLTSKPVDGYDTGTLARDLVALMDVLGHERFAVVGHDTGMPIAYALAADHPDRLDRLAVAEAVLPGVSPSPPLLAAAQLNNRLWHLAFNRVAEVNEQLVRGREDIYFGWQLDTKAARKLPDYAVRYYIKSLARDSDALRGSFGWYRALDATMAQNEQRRTRRLTLPVLAVGGATSSGEAIGDAMRLAADDVQSVVIPGCGHWVAEEAPEEMLAALTAFLGPYRRGPNAADGPGSHAPAGSRSLR